MTGIRYVRLVSAIIGISIPILAQVAADHIISDVSKLLERDVSDKKIARRISELQPTYYLSEQNIEELDQKQELGPRTLFALHVLASKSIYLDPAPTEDRPADAPPDPALTRELEQSIRTQITQSLELLPKFICKKQETLTSNCRGGFPAKTPSVCDEQWHTITPYYFGRASVFDNDVVPIGHFKTVLRSSLQWKRWDLCRGQKCAVFSFIENHGDSKDSVQTASPHAHGLVFYSPTDGTVCRLITTLVFSDRGMTTDITEFGTILMENSTYHFPVKSITVTHHEGHVHWLRQVVLMSEYHKLKADSNIIYGPPK